MPYRNGQFPASALVPVPGLPGARLTPAAAASWGRVCAQVHAAYGWTPMLTGPLDAYRPLSGSYYAQTETFLRRYVRRDTGSGDRRYYDSDGNGVKEAFWRLAGQAAAAVPGTSNHGWAKACDVTGLGGFDGTRYHQFAAIARRNGWTNTEGASIGEAWHWVYAEAADTVAHTVATGGSVPATPTGSLPDPLNPTQEDDMAIYLVGDRAPDVFALDTVTGYRRGVGTLEYSIVVAAGVPVTRLAQADLDALPKISAEGNTLDKLRVEVRYGTEEARAQTATLVAAIAAGADVDEVAIAKALAPLVVPQVVAAVAAKTTLTPAQVQAATAAALRDVLGSLKP